MNFKSVFKSSIFRFSAKLAFVVILMVFLAQKGFLSLEATRRAFQNYNYMLAGVGGLMISSLLCFCRWQILLRALGIHLPWSRTFQLGFVGTFFNIALPGAVTGDVVKAIYVAKEAPGKRAWALASILFDRVAGLSALILVSAGALLIGKTVGWGAGLFRALSLFVGPLGFLVILFFGYLFYVTENRDPLLKFFRWLQGRVEKMGSLTRIYEGLRHYHNQRGAVLAAMGISIVVHLLVIYSCLNFTWALGEMHVAPLGIFAIVPLCLVVTALPIMPGGVGTGHLAFAAFFSNYLHSQRGADIFTLYLLFMMAWGAVGGVVYLKFKSRGEVGATEFDFSEKPI